MSILLDVEMLVESCIKDKIERETMTNGLIDILSRIITCTATERAFLDKLRELFHVPFIDATCIVTKMPMCDDEHAFLFDEDFPGINLKELVNESE